MLDDLDDYGVDGDLDDFVVDDDGAGYTSGRKRPAEDAGEPASKRRHLAQPADPPPFPARRHPRRGNRKYLCLNLVGVVWTVDQDAHHTVTVEFYERGQYRDFHFTDNFLYAQGVPEREGRAVLVPAEGGRGGARVRVLQAARDVDVEGGLED